MALQEDALGNSRILNLSFQNVQRVVLEIVVDGALAETVVLVGTLDNWLLEVGTEVENLIKLELLFEAESKRIIKLMRAGGRHLPDGRV